MPAMHEPVFSGSIYDEAPTEGGPAAALPGSQRWSRPPELIVKENRQRRAAGAGLAIEDRAVTTEFLRDLTKTLCKEDVLVKTTRDVVRRVVKPETDQARLRFVDLGWVRDWKAWDGTPAVGRSTYFVSHSWDSPFEDLVSALESHREKLGPKPPGEEVRYWVDILAINQWFGTDEMAEDLPDWDSMEKDMEADAAAMLRGSLQHIDDR